MRNKLLFLTVVSGSILTACSGLPQKTTSTTLNYSCGENFSFTAQLTANQATLLLPDRTLVLPRMSDTKGERYLSEDRKILFLRKAENAVLATGAGHNMLRCKQSTPED